ncbi:restriction endonuclease subunit S [Stutzerimonas frequens]|uniref:restriction endonuclease subunit S n=1 Tax=Stutzerimonas frequens TaxID=2968969 RepID=UPI002DB7CC33|nr:restriction endonuclease subunit S [Stutzerimonas frequens]WRW27413.1 restriction endonuclease subunit S [Stutzerimonas frequens]
MSELPLPNGWVQASLGDLAEFTNGKAFKKEEWLEAGKPIIRIQNLNNPSATFNYADDSHEEKYLVRNGDLLVSWSASLGVYYWNGGDAWLNQHIFRVSDLRGCDKSFLKYALETSIDAFYAKAHGMGIVHITKGNFENHLVPLPPLAEQTRIATKLDELLAQVDTLKARIDGIPALLKRFRQSLLAAAVSGRLSEEWRGGEEYFTETLMLTDLVDSSLVGLVRSAAEQSDDANYGTPYLKMNNINNDWGSALKSLVYVSVSEAEAERYSLAAGDWLFNTRNSQELVGKSCVWRDAGNSFVFNNNILRIRFSDRALPEFIEIWFRSPLGRAALEKVKSATTSVAAIYQKALMSQTLPLPEIAEQTEIVRRVEQLFAFADQLEARVKAAQVRIDRLTQSILAKAFRGELVPQDPNDEPASVLLERIKAQRAAAPKARRGRRAATLG